MKPGDLVKHHLDDNTEGYGLITALHPRVSGRPDSMVRVQWSNPTNTHRNDWLYRAGELEIINENW